MQNDTLKWWFKNLVYIVLNALILFLLAGTFSWASAWAYLALILVIIIANAYAMDRELMADRAQVREGTKKWDLFLASFVAIWGPLVLLVTAGLDKRLTWSEGFALELQLIAGILFLLGGLTGSWAMAANRFFSSTVRIQNERSHAVVSSGPYRLVRHPGYAGGILSILAVPVILESWLALIPAALVTGAFILRTVLEDRVLQEELAGYSEYCRKVRYRLVPGIW